ncbi:MAG TPA: purine-nucleoside phosphorylase, partial [Gemmatimonadaceae bacterium]|nr:purine-nucleoside phosphorylase [Gemmatimonadaceae bacterium]
MSDSRLNGAAAAEAAAATIRDRLGVNAPVAAIVLGSGLGDLAERVENPKNVPYAEIPGFHATNIVGHRGELICGTLAGREVLALAGRFHMYEGHGARTAAYPVRVLRALGAKVLFVSNAAGGISRAFAPGDLMIIEDHLNLMYRNPLFGAVESTDDRFPDMSAPWSPRLIALLKECAKKTGVPIKSGVYAGLLGPNYETPAEVRMLATLGADAVGMSTVPEAIVAGAMKMELAGVSLITNAAAGISESPLNHSEVVEAGAAAAGKFAALVTE